MHMVFGLKLLARRLKGRARIFELKQFDEHPAWENEKLPGEFTVVAVKRGKSQES